MFVFTLLKLTGLLLTGLVLLATLSLGNPLRGTSLTSTWRWGLAAQSAWVITALASVLASPGSPVLDQAWFWTGILSLCPFISVLGARRPASRVWSWFIVLPLLAVLGWPALTVMADWPELAPLRIQTPFCVGFALVLLMGLGNYMGTRFTAPSLLAGLAFLLTLAPLSTRLNLSSSATQSVRILAEIAYVSAVIQGIRQGLRNESEPDPWNRLWFQFRDTFGIVWSLRIQERLNEMAEKEGWSSRLTPDGFEWEPACGESHRRETLTRMEHALRWHLRRFVDPEWINDCLIPPPDLPPEDGRAADS